jgi:FixJ family two-component response regulator
MSSVQAMKEQPSTVVIIDDDPGIRDSLGIFLRSMGFQVKLLGSVSEFIKSGRPKGPTCLMLDVRLPGQSGPEFQREPSAANSQLLVAGTAP